MRINDSVLLSKALLVLKKVYWAWLAVCFLNSFRLALSVALDYQEFSKLFDSLIFDSKFGSYLTYSIIFMPVIFIMISIARRKVSAWEFCLITVTWGMMFYVFSHSRS